MTEDKDWIGFCEIMNLAADLTNCKQKSEDALSFLFEMLKKYSLFEVTNAIKRHIETNRFFPTPADIIQQIKGTAEERGQKAFQYVLTAIRKHGRYSSVEFGDPRIHYCIKMVGGWNRICDTNEDELKWVQKEFCNFYSQSERENVNWGHSDVPALITGIFEQHNRKSGFEVEKAKRVDCGKLNIKKPENYKAIEDKQMPGNVININSIAKGF